METLITGDGRALLFSWWPTTQTVSVGLLCRIGVSGSPEAVLISVLSFVDGPDFRHSQWVSESSPTQRLALETSTPVPSDSDRPLDSNLNGGAPVCSAV